MTLPASLETDERYRGRLMEMVTPDDIPHYWKGTPVESLILAENFDTKIEPKGRPELLIVACIEFRYALPIPSMYAYVVRRASGRLVGSEFSLAYVISKGVDYVVLLGHNDCGMAKVPEAGPAMVEALVREGWHRDRAQEYVAYQAARYSIGDELESLEKEYIRLRRLFKRVHFAPLFVCLADKKLYLPKWFHEHMEKGTLLDAENQKALVSDEELLTLM